MGCGSVINSRTSPVRWFPADSPTSDEILLRSTGYGIGRNKSFFRAISTKHGVNRRGNEFGQLGGKLVFFHSAKSNDDYSNCPTSPVIRLKKSRKIFAKAFLMCPLGRLPIGENNISVKGAVKYDRGPVLLTASPRVIAVFVSVDGEQKASEILCDESVDVMKRQYRDFQPQPQWLTHAIPGSFFTYMPTREQDEYFFIQFPLVADLEDTLLDTGNYAADLVSTFCELLLSLSPGFHELSIQVKGFHDHCDYNYFVTDKNLNAMGHWGTKLSNARLTDPHPNPKPLQLMSPFIATGNMKLLVPSSVTPLIHGLLERKPPVERYKASDKEQMRKEAKVVAAGRFCHSFNLDGLPDILVLTSERIERKMKDEASGQLQNFEVIEFAAIWLNTDDPNPQAEGFMLEGGMARPDSQGQKNPPAWTWTPVQRAGKTINPVPLPLKNKHIWARMPIKPQQNLEASKETSLPTPAN